MENIVQNHMIFIDDIKLLAKSEEALVELCVHTNNCLEKMGFKVNRAKSTSNVSNESFFGDKIDDMVGYKYLGVLENSRNVVKGENKILLANKLLERTKKLCQTKLNAVNLFRGINEYALSTLNYYVGLLPYEQKDLKSWTRK